MIRHHDMSARTCLVSIPSYKLEDLSVPKIRLRFGGSP